MNKVFDLRASASFSGVRAISLSQCVSVCVKGYKRGGCLLTLNLVERLDDARTPRQSQGEGCLYMEWVRKLGFRCKCMFAVFFFCFFFWVCARVGGELSSGVTEGIIICGVLIRKWMCVVIRNMVGIKYTMGSMFYDEAVGI